MLIIIEFISGNRQEYCFLVDSMQELVFFLIGAERCVSYSYDPRLVSYRILVQGSRCNVDVSVQPHRNAIVNIHAPKYFFILQRCKSLGIQQRLEIKYLCFSRVEPDPKLMIFHGANSTDTDSSLSFSCICDTVLDKYNCSSLMKRLLPLYRISISLILSWTFATQLFLKK